MRLTTRKDGKGRNPSVEEGPIGLTASLSRAEGPADAGGPYPYRSLALASARFADVTLLRAPAAMAGALLLSIAS